MQNPLISVIVPIYNVEKYLDKCVQSILAQTYANIEIFLVDDGTPDRCGVMCDEYARQDSRIKVIHKPNGGLSDARNVAIDVATGEWITFIDSDDFVTEDYVETLYRLCEKYDCKMSVSQHVECKEGTEPNYTYKKTIELCQRSDDAIRDMFYNKYYDTSAWAKLYHRSLFESGIRYPKGLLHEDLPTTYLLMDKAGKVAYSNKEVYCYLLRESGIEGSSFNEKKLNSLKTIFQMMECNMDVLSRVWRGYVCKKVSFMYHIFLQMPDEHPEKKELFNMIKQYRWGIILDANARRKTRVACIISLFGPTAVKKLFSFVNKRK